MFTNKPLNFHINCRWSTGKVLAIWPISNGMTPKQACFYFCSGRVLKDLGRWTYGIGLEGPGLGLEDRGLGLMIFPRLRHYY